MTEHMESAAARDTWNWLQKLFFINEVSVTDPLPPAPWVISSIVMSFYIIWAGFFAAGLHHQRRWRALPKSATGAGQHVVHERIGVGSRPNVQQMQYMSMRNASEDDAAKVRKHDHCSFSPQGGFPHSRQDSQPIRKASATSSSSHVNHQQNVAWARGKAARPARQVSATRSTESTGGRAQESKGIKNEDKTVAIPKPKVQGTELCNHRYQEKHELPEAKPFAIESTEIPGPRQTRQVNASDERARALEKWRSERISANTREGSICRTTASVAAGTDTAKKGANNPTVVCMKAAPQLPAVPSGSSKAAFRQNFLDGSDVAELSLLRKEVQDVPDKTASLPSRKDTPRQKPSDGGAQQVVGVVVSKLSEDAAAWPKTDKYRWMRETASELDAISKAVAGQPQQFKDLSSSRIKKDASSQSHSNTGVSQMYFARDQSPIRQKHSTASSKYRPACGPEVRNHTPLRTVAVAKENAQCGPCQALGDDNVISKYPQRPRTPLRGRQSSQGISKGPPKVPGRHSMPGQGGPHRGVAPSSQRMMGDGAPGLQVQQKENLTLEGNPVKLASRNDIGAWAIGLGAVPTLPVFMDSENSNSAVGAGIVDEVPSLSSDAHEMMMKVLKQRLHALQAARNQRCRHTGN